MKKIGQKTVSVLEACSSGNSGGEGDQPLATMTILRIHLNLLFPTNLQEKYFKMFQQPTWDVKLTVSIITGVFCNDTHRLVEANKVDVSQFDIIGADMDKEVRLYLAPLFAFNPASFEPPILGMGSGPIWIKRSVCI